MKVELGKLANEKDKGMRDALHTPVICLKAGCHLGPGQYIKIVNGVAKAAMYDTYNAVVDPFITNGNGVLQGQYFWAFIKPNLVQNLRHEWSFPNEKEKVGSEQAIKNQIISLLEQLRKENEDLKEDLEDTKRDLEETRNELDGISTDECAGCY